MGSSSLEQHGNDGVIPAASFAEFSSDPSWAHAQIQLSNDVTRLHSVTSAQGHGITAYRPGGHWAESWPAGLQLAVQACGE